MGSRRAAQLACGSSSSTPYRSFAACKLLCEDCELCKTEQLLADSGLLLHRRGTAERPPAHLPGVRVLPAILRQLRWLVLREAWRTDGPCIFANAGALCLRGSTLSLLVPTAGSGLVGDVRNESHTQRAHTVHEMRSRLSSRFRPAFVLLPWCGSFATLQCFTNGTMIVSNF